MTDLRPGDTVGDYLVERVLGRGGMGTVLVATHHRLRRRLALKVMNADLARDPGFRARFAREYSLLTRVDSPHIVQVIDHGEQDGALFLAMQYIEGRDLATTVEAGPLPVGAALKVADDVAAALEDAHRAGVLHRDVKPQNVLLRGDRPAHQPHAYLCDFGVAAGNTESDVDGDGDVELVRWAASGPVEVQVYDVVGGLLEPTTSGTLEGTADALDGAGKGDLVR